MIGKPFFTGLVIGVGIGAVFSDTIFESLHIGLRKSSQKLSDLETRLSETEAKLAEAEAKATDNLRDQAS